MNSHGKRHPPPRWLLLGCALAAMGSAALLAGCKGNTTSAAVTERHVTKPPTIVAGRAAGDIQASNPLNGDIWKNAEWVEFSAPINNSRTTPPTRCAVLFDEQTLYIAAVSQTPATRAPEATDKISFYVDTTAKGYELLEFSAAGGKVECTWLRSNSPAEPLEDGSPTLVSRFTSCPTSKFPASGAENSPARLENKQWSLASRWHPCPHQCGLHPARRHPGRSMR